MPPLIALATCDDLLPEGDLGDQPLRAALSDRGAKVVVASWSDPDVDWAAFDLTLIRSTWDYSARREEFLRWLPRVPRLHNPAGVVAANSDKRYLRELIGRGLPIIPTSFAEPGQRIELPEVGEYVLKPSVGAGSRGAGRFHSGSASEDARARSHVDHLHAAGRTVLRQPYIGAVDQVGETGLVFIDGVFSHAIRKGRMLAEGVAFDATGPSLFIEENITARSPTAVEREVAERVLAALTPTEPSAGPLLYARIDLLPGPDGPLLVEAELTEPSLFFEHGPGSAERLAEATLRRLEP